MITLDTGYMFNCGYRPGGSLCLSSPEHNYLDFHFRQDTTLRGVYMSASLHGDTCNTGVKSVNKKINKDPYAAAIKAAIDHHELWPVAVLTLFNFSLLVKMYPWLRGFRQ